MKVDTMTRYQYRACERAILEIQSAARYTLRIMNIESTEEYAKKAQARVLQAIINDLHLPYKLTKA